VGIKIHTLLDNETNLPRFVNVSVAKEHDLIAARTLSLPKESIVAMDRGYVDYSLFYRWTTEGIFFGTRSKENMNYDVIKELDTLKSESQPYEPSLNKEDKRKGKNTAKKAKKARGHKEKKLLAKSSRIPCQVLKDQVIRLRSKKAYEDCP
jgi:hypothetical protein